MVDEKEFLDKMVPYLNQVNTRLFSRSSSFENDWDEQNKKYQLHTYLRDTPWINVRDIEEDTKQLELAIESTIRDILAEINDMLDIQSIRQPLIVKLEGAPYTERLQLSFTYRVIRG